MSNEIIRISNIARQHQKIDTVMYALNKENLKQSAKRMAGNKAVGIDEVTKQEYIQDLDNNITRLVEEMKKLSYRPKAVRRVYIPKTGSDKKIPLGIPAFEDKIVQDVMTQILNAIYEPMFKEFSFGFRPNRNCHQAIAYLDMMLHRKKVNYVVDLDIKGFFDNIDHEWLIKFLEYRINDRVYIRYVKRFLKSGIMEQGKLLKSNRKTKKRIIPKSKKNNALDILSCVHICELQLILYALQSLFCFVMRPLLRAEESQVYSTRPYIEDAEGYKTAVNPDDVSAPFNWNDC